MTTSGNPQAPKRVRLLVEVVVDQQTSPVELFELARRWEVAGLHVDRSYAPVPIPPPRTQRAEIRKAGMRTFIMRVVVDPDQIAALERQDHVRRTWPDGRLEPTASRKAALGVDCAATGQPVGDLRRLVRKLGVDKIWSAGYRGEGIVVAMVDGGIAAHGRPVTAGELPAIPSPPATGLVVGGWPADWGTSALGWGQHANMTAFDVQAVAPAASLWDIRIFEPGAAFGAYVSNAVSGYRAAIDSHRVSGAPHILSNSWGLYDSSKDPAYASDPDSPFARVVEEALDEGILVLFSAGNCGERCPFSLCGATDTGPGKSILGPNGHPDVMTVGAADLDDEWCAYTSQGLAVLPPHAPKPDFCAYTRFDGYFPSADWTLRDFDGGTSAAAAVAAGVVALLKQKRPGLTQEEAKAALMQTAEDIWAPGFDLNTGAGIIRAKAAFDAI
jgi:subtilisin family serine protease